MAEPAPGRSRRWIAWTLAAVGVAAAIAAAATWRRVAEPPSFRALTFRRGSMGGARFGPDGQTVIYAAAWQGKPMQLYSTRADSTESSPMSASERRPPRRVVDGQDGDRSLNRDDNGRRRRNLARGRRAARALRGRGAGGLLPRPDDRTVIARNGKLECPPGKVLYDPGEDRWIDSPRFSPDGRWIAFIEHAGPRSAIAAIDLSGKKRTLSDGWETTPSLAWHPQTGEVWFSAREFSGFGIVNLHAVSLSGKHRVVARGPLLLLIQDIARDGRVLLRADDWTETTMGLPPGAVQETDLTWLDFSRVADLSSDGRLLLLTEGGIAGGANAAVYLRNTDGSAAVRLGEGIAHALSPDEKWAITAKGKETRAAAHGRRSSRRDPRDSGARGPVARMVSRREEDLLPRGRSREADAHLRPGCGRRRPAAHHARGLRRTGISPDGKFIVGAERSKARLPVPGRRRRSLPLPGFPAGRRGSCDSTRREPGSSWPRSRCR